MASVTPTPAPRPGLHIRLINHDIADEDITCACEIGRPGNDQTVMMCRTCGKWQHLNCMVGDKTVAPSEQRSGYQCRPCKRIMRSEAAKRGYQNRMNAVSALQTPSTTPASQQPSKGSSIRHISSFKLPMPSLKPAEKPGECVDEDDEEPLPYGKEEKESIHDKVTKWAAGDAAGREAVQNETPRRKTLKDAMDQWKASKPKISCDCPGGPSGVLSDYLFCHSCRMMQHRICLPRGDGSESVIQGDFCKECRAAMYQKHLDKVQHRHRQVLQVAARQYREITTWCEQALWRDYCRLPKGEATPAVVDQTSTYYNNGEMVPVHPAPKEWVVEMRLRINRLSCAAGGAKLREMRGADGSGLRFEEGTMVAWRKLAVWVLHHGAYKRSREELGVLAEVLGLEEKGHFWKG